MCNFPTTGKIHPERLTGLGHCYESYCESYCEALTVTHLPAVYHMSTYHPILSGIRTFKLWKREKWSVMICATRLVLHSSPSHQIHLVFSTSPPALLCLCQTALWAVASQVTWANRRLYIPAEHSFALRGFPPLSLPLSLLFVSVHSCTVASDSSRGLHFYPRHSSPCFAPFLCRVITERMQCFFVLKFSDP